MAYVTSNKYKNTIYSESSNSYLKIYINNVEIDTDYIREFTLNDDVFEEEAFTLGSAIIQSVTLKLDNECLPCEIKNVKDVKIDYGLELDDNTIEWIPIGIYEVVKEPDTTYSDYTTFTLYDYMNRFDDEYDASSIVPCTRYQLVQDICRKFNVELGSASFLNGDVIVNSYDNTITAKTYLSFISERSAGFAKIGRDGKLYIKSFSDVDVIELSENDSESAVVNNFDSLKTVSKVIYEDAINKFEFGDDTGLTIKLSSDNPLSIDETETQKIYNSVKNLSFQSADIKMWVDPAYDTGDILCVSGYKTFIQKKFSYGNGFYGNYKTTLKDINVKSNVDKISNSTKIKKYQAKIDELNGKIVLMAQEIDGQDEKISQITQTVDELTEQVSELVTISNTITGNGTITLENAHKGILHSLEITGDISLLYPSDDLYPSDTLYPIIMNLIVDDTEYILDFDYLNYINSTVCDKYVYQDGKQWVERNVGVDSNGNKYALEETVIEEFEDMQIIIDKASVISMPAFDNAVLSCTYLLENQYTDNFATQIQVKSEINLKANELEEKVSSVADENGNVTSASIVLAINKDESSAVINADKISLEGKTINLTSDDIVIDSRYFKLDKYGNLTATSATLSGTLKNYSTNGYLAVEIKGTNENFYDYLGTGEVVGSISSITSNNNLSLKGIEMYTYLGKEIVLGYKESTDTTLIKTIFSFDTNDLTSTPWIINTASGTLMPNNDYGIVVQNGLIKSWNMPTGTTGDLYLMDSGGSAQVTVHIRNGLITGWSV